MKKLFTLLTMLLVGIGSSWGEDGTVVATMSDLVTGAGFSNVKTVKENSIYSFSYNTYIGAIDNSAVTSAYEGSGYVTVAMWIWGNSASGCLFGYGDQGTGVKFYISETTVKITTKGIDDYETVNLSGNINANQWNLIAFATPAINGTWGTNIRYYATAQNGTFWTKTKSKGNMNSPTADGKKYAIGSGNQGNAREPFTGILANVTVIQSTNLLNNSRIAELIGPAPSSSVWYKPAFGGRTWTWNTNTNKYDASDGTTSTGTPARANDKGPVYLFNSVGTITATGNVNTSDYGGAWVIGTRDNPSKVTVGIGSWAGSIEVETYQTANITYSIDLKSTEPDGFATVWTDGTLNFPNRSSCSINDGNNQRWYIGENGIITTNFTSVNKGNMGNRQWNFQIVVADDPLVGETDTRIIHVRKRKVMTWGANISSDINGVTVFHKADDGTLTEKNTTNDANFEVTYDNTGMYVTYTCKGYFNTNDPNYTYTYSGGAGTSGSRVSINHNGGSVKLSGANKTYYLTGSNSATQTTINFDGTTVNYNNELGIGTATYNINDTKITTPKFITSQGGAGRSAVVNLTGNSVIIVTGNSNVDTNESSIMIGHWNGSSNLTLSGTAQIVAADAQLLVGKTRNNQTITLNGSSNITAKGIKAASDASGTNTLNLNGGSLNLGDVGITSYSSSRSIAVNVNENTIITATASTLPLSQPITIASGKTLTIDGGESNATVQLTGSITKANDGTIKLKNARIEGGEIRNCSSLPLYTYENCTLVINETTKEFDEEDETITITKIPDGFTSVRLRRVDRKYITLDVVDGTATFTDSEAKVSGPKCLYDFTFSKETLAERKIENTSVILNSGSRGSSNGLNYDSNFNSGNSYNEETGLLKAKSTPWRDMSGGNAWPINYSVAVYANVPDIENGCLMAFGSVNGTGNYLALLRGASSNEIKLVKGHETNNAFEVIATMSAENAAVAKHLVIFTKNGSTFKVYCDGVNVATTTYDQTLGAGFQIGSVHGGVTGTGIIRINDNSVSSEVKDAVEIQSIRIFNGVLTDGQMSALIEEFPYVSKGGSYSREISADANLGEDNAWVASDETTSHIPTPVVEDASTYYPGVTLTTSANATLTVNENATFGKTTFGGSGTLTIAANEGHSLNIGGAVIINSDVVVKFGAMDMSTSPVTKGADANITFDFSDFNFNKVYTTTKYQLTGLIEQDDTRITATGLPTDDDNRAYVFEFDDNHYWLTVTVRAPQDVYAPAGTTSITDNMPVKLTAEAATNNGLLIQDDNLVFVEDATVQFNQTPDFCGIKVQEGANVTVDANGSPMKIVSGTVIAQNGTTIGAVTGSGTLSVPAETSITVASVATGTTLEGAGNVTMTSFTRSMNPTLTNWVGTIAVEDASVGGPFVIDNLVNGNNSLVKMTHIQGWIDQGSTTTANIVLDNEEWTYGFNVAGVNEGASYTFTGGISGTGDFMYRQSNQESRTATFNFSGDLSKWTGKFNLNENGTGTTTVKVTSTDNINAGFANTATKANTLKVTFESSEAQNIKGEISNSNTGNGSLVLKLLGTGAKTISANINVSRLKVVKADGAEITISGTPTISVGQLEAYTDDNNTAKTSLNIRMSEADITAKLNGNASCSLIDVANGGNVNVTSFTINDAEKCTIGDYEYYISHDSEGTNDIVLVKHYVRNVTSGNFGSICLPNGSTVATGIEKVLEIKEVTSDRVVMNEVDEMIAGVPYIFKSNASKIDITLNGEDAEEPDNTTQDYLVGNFAPADVPNSDNDAEYNYYILQSNQFKKVTSGSGTIKSGKNRCYLKVGKSEMSRQSTLGIAVDESGATGIDVLNSLMNNDAEIYDLNGRRLNDLRKGINIVNGVKVIVK